MILNNYGIFKKNIYLIYWRQLLFPVRWIWCWPNLDSATWYRRRLNTIRFILAFSGCCYQTNNVFDKRGNILFGSRHYPTKPQTTGTRRTTCDRRCVTHGQARVFLNIKKTDYTKSPERRRATEINTGRTRKQEWGWWGRTAMSRRRRTATLMQCCGCWRNMVSAFGRERLGKVDKPKYHNKNSWWTMCGIPWKKNAKNARYDGCDLNFRNSSTVVKNY